MDTEVVTLHLPVNLYVELQALATDEQEDLVDVITRLVAIAREFSPKPELEPQPPTPAFQNILDHAIDLGITDLAEQHDHYLYRVEKH